MSVALSAQDISRALTRISHEILEKNHGSSDITVLGIPTRGAHLAARIAAIMSSIEGKEIAHGTLDITLYRDDLRLRPPRTIMPTSIPPIGIQGRDVILIDDVLYTGRTVHAAMTAIQDFGRPERIEMLCLVDRRFNRHFPIRADYSGMAVDALDEAYVRVSWEGQGTQDEVRLFSGKSQTIA